MDKLEMCSSVLVIGIIFLSIVLVQIVEGVLIDKIGIGVYIVGENVVVWVLEYLYFVVAVFSKLIFQVEVFGKDGVLFGSFVVVYVQVVVYLN